MIQPPTICHSMVEFRIHLYGCVVIDNSRFAMTRNVNEPQICVRRCHAEYLQFAN